MKQENGKTKFQTLNLLVDVPMDDINIVAFYVCVSMSRELQVPID